MIGVDVIDRQYSFHSSKYSFEQLAGKILSDSEIHYCQSISDLDIIWAIKESAYKVWSSTQNSSFFNAKKIQVTSYSSTTDQAKVCIEGMKIYSQVIVKENYIFSLSSLVEDTTSCNLFFDRWNHDSGLSERTHFTANSRHEFVPIMHPMGFVSKVRMNGQTYHYSRSHHGRYYLSAIMR